MTKEKLFALIGVCLGFNSIDFHNGFVREEIGHRRFHIRWFVFIERHWEMSNINDIWIEVKRIETSTIARQRAIESKYLHIPIKCNVLA